jgi:hypothetical protein
MLQGIDPRVSSKGPWLVSWRAWNSFDRVPSKIGGIFISCFFLGKIK